MLMTANTVAICKLDTELDKLNVVRIHTPGNYVH